MIGMLFLRSITPYPYLSGPYFVAGFGGFGFIAVVFTGLLLDTMVCTWQSTRVRPIKQI